MKFNHADMISEKLASLKPEKQQEIQSKFIKKYGLSEAMDNEQLKEAMRDKHLRQFDKLIGKKNEGSSGKKVCSSLVYGLVTPGVHSRRANFKTMGMQQHSSFMMLQNLGTTARKGEANVVQTFEQKKLEAQKIDKITQRSDIGSLKLEREEKVKEKVKEEEENLKEKVFADDKQSIMDKMKSMDNSSLLKRFGGIEKVNQKKEEGGASKETPDVQKPEEKKLDDFGIFKKKPKRVGRMRGLPI